MIIFKIIRVYNLLRKKNVNPCCLNLNKTNFIIILTILNHLHKKRWIIFLNIWMYFSLNVKKKIRKIWLNFLKI